MINPGSHPAMGLTLHTLMCFSRKGYTFAALLSQPCLLSTSGTCSDNTMPGHGVGTGKGGMAPEMMETMTLILKALNSLALARAL